MEEKKVLLSIKDLWVKFRVRGRVLTAIRNVSLDIYENESIAIVGESGCGKSVLTKTFAGMLDNNGFIDGGSIVFNDETLTEVSFNVGPGAIAKAEAKLNEYSKLELGAQTYLEMRALERDREERLTLSGEDAERFEKQRRELRFRRAQLHNDRQTLDRSKEKARIKEASRRIAELDAELKELERRRRATVREQTASTKGDSAYNAEYSRRMAALRERYSRECAGELSPGQRERNSILAREICLSLGRYPLKGRRKLEDKLYRAIKEAMTIGADLSDESQLNGIFENAVFRVKYLGQEGNKLRGSLVLDLARTDCVVDWTRIRGQRIATIFQDPMTSLNPIMTIGKQITSVIMKHQNVSEIEARKRAIVLMKKVGIPNAENRFDDYPFQYSGGMRQRIVIAIALSCQPRILICDEPTTALDVTIQAQIIKLIKDLQKEFGYTIVFITHDLGVVANVADRVAVLYAGQIVELGTVEEVFYDPRHPYTWALLSSLPQLMDRGMKLYSIAGTPPSLYNDIVGDAFAPRNPYCLRVDTLREPPMFKVSDTHYAKTWLLDPRAPKVEKPEMIRDIHGTLMKVFNI